jgi:hypothetical protein
MSQEQPSTTAAGISASPWFWAMLFCAVGVVVLLVGSGQYSKRQHRLEMQYRARREVERRQVEGTAGLDSDAGTPPPSAEELVIPLWPLIALFASLFAVSGFMLWRLKRMATARDPENLPVP